MPAWVQPRREGPRCLLGRLSKLMNGLLSIDLIHDLPPEMRPRQIPIARAAGAIPAPERDPKAA